MQSVKQGDIKYYFLSLWYNSIFLRTVVSYIHNEERTTALGSNNI